MEEVNHSLSQQLQMLKDTFSKTKREKQQYTRTVQNDSRQSRTRKQNCAKRNRARQGYAS